MLELMPGDVLLGQDHLVVAEVAQAHDGDSAAAHRLIDSAAAAGAHAVKFQTHLAAHESTVREPWRVKFSDRDSSRYDYWRRMEFSLSQWRDLKAHCDDVGVEFLSSPFSPQAVDLLMNIGVRVWKIASGEVSNTQLLASVTSTRLPVILSSGLSTIPELERAASVLGLAESSLGILQCATQYPTAPDRVGLNVLAEYERRFRCVVGISDHTATIFSPIAAAALGARIFEVHIREDHDSVGPDASSSLTGSQISELVRGVAFVRTALKNPVDKETLTAEQMRLREIFGRSLVAARSLESGTKLTKHDFAYKKPGGGLPFEAVDLLVGKTLSRSLEADEVVSLEDLA